jgi:hypothetical protein
MQAEGTMADPTIAETRKGTKDVSDEEIQCIYAKKPPEYLVYRNTMRVMVQFADDPAKATEQRLAFAALNALRGQVTGLIDGWHNSNDAAKQARAKRYDRRVADAMVTALEGGIPDALALLAEVRDDIIAERKSIAQTDYLLVAALFGITLLIVIGVLGSPRFTPLPIVPPHTDLIWAGAAGGVLGAFFSIATGMRTRSILIDLQQRDNRRDALLRMTVGTLAGGILLSLFLTNMASIGQISRDSLINGRIIEPLLLATVLGFIGGFSERAVPGLLSRASLSIEDGADDVAVKQARVAGAAVAAARSRAGESTTEVVTETKFERRKPDPGDGKPDLKGVIRRGSVLPPLKGTGSKPEPPEDAERTPENHTA